MTLLIVSYVSQFWKECFDCQMSSFSCNFFCTPKWQKGNAFSCDPVLHKEHKSQASKKITFLSTRSIFNFFGPPKSFFRVCKQLLFALKLLFLTLVICTFNSWQVFKNQTWLWPKGFSSSNSETYLKVGKSVCLHTDIGMRRHWN